MTETQVIEKPGDARRKLREAITAEKLAWLAYVKEAALLRDLVNLADAELSGLILGLGMLREEAGE